MPQKPLDLPMKVAKAFVKDMKLYFAEPNAIKRDFIAGLQLQALRPYNPRYGKKLRITASSLTREAEVQAQQSVAEGEAFEPERSLTPLEPPVSAPPDARCLPRPRTRRLPWARQMPLGADRLSRDYRSQVSNKVLGFCLSHRRG